MNHDHTPAPYGTVTRRWTQLTDHDRDREARRLAGVGIDAARIERPDATTGHHYLQLVTAARTNDEVAFAWLATTHRPLLLDRGRVLFAADPQEWGSVALELLNRVVHEADLDDGRWLRSEVSQRLHRLMVRQVRTHLRRYDREQLTDPSKLCALHAAAAPIDADAHLDLTAAIATAFGRLDEPTRAGLQALIEERTLASVARDHGVNAATLRQRIHRARHRLRPELTAYHRVAV